MLPTALEYPSGDLNVFRVYRPARGGRSCERFGGYKTINRISLHLPLYLGALDWETRLCFGLRFVDPVPALGSTLALFSTINVDQRFPFRSPSQVNVETVQIPFSHHVDQR